MAILGRHLDVGLGHELGAEGIEALAPSISIVIEPKYVLVSTYPCRKQALKLSGYIDAMKQTR